MSPFSPHAAIPVTQIRKPDRPGAEPVDPLAAARRTRWRRRRAGHQADQRAGHQAGHQADRRAGHQADPTAGHQADQRADQRAGHQADRRAGHQAGQMVDPLADRRAGRRAGQMVDPRAGPTADQRGDRRAGPMVDPLADRRAGRRVGWWIRAWVCGRVGSRVRSWVGPGSRRWIGHRSRLAAVRVRPVAPGSRRSVRRGRRRRRRSDGRRRRRVREPLKVSLRPGGIKGRVAQFEPGALGTAARSIGRLPDQRRAREFRPWTAAPKRNPGRRREDDRSRRRHRSHCPRRAHRPRAVPCGCGPGAGGICSYSYRPAGRHGRGRLLRARRRVHHRLRGHGPPRESRRATDSAAAQAASPAPSRSWSTTESSRAYGSSSSRPADPTVISPSSGRETFMP